MEVFIRKKKLCLKTIASAAGWDFSRLPSSNTDFRLVSHHNHISQFREIYVYFPTGYVFSGLSVSLFLAGTNPEEKTGNWNPQKRPSRRSLKTKWKQASAHVRTPEKSEEAKKGKKRKKKKQKTPYKSFKRMGGLCRYYVEQRDPGHGGGLFVPHFLKVRLQPPWPSLSSKEQILTVLIKGGAAPETARSKIKGTREAHQN